MVERPGLEGHGTGPTTVAVTVNGERRVADAAVPLLVALRRDWGLTGAKPGCGEGACGACSVLVEGRPTASCQARVGDVAGREVLTIEGLGHGALHPVQSAFAELGAVQCGYCTPAMVLAVVALLEREADPDDTAIDEALEPHVCRCGEYPAIRRAVHRAVEIARGAPPVPPADPAGERWALPGWDRPSARPEMPWDLSDPERADWFDVLGDGLVVVLPPPPPDPSAWTTGVGAWLHLDARGRVTAFTGKVDVGQDNTTALRLLVAEELGVDVDHVSLAMGDTDVCPFDRGTFGSRSMPDAGQALRRVAAFAARCRRPDPGERRVEVARGGVELSDPRRWRQAGRPRVPDGVLGRVTGAQRFVTDLQGAGLRHGAVLRPPALGARLVSYDEGALGGRDDVTLVTGSGLVGVVADDAAVARAALGELAARWTVPEWPSADGLEAYLRTHPVTEGQGWEGPWREERGAPDDALAAAPVRLAATYTTAYIAHAPLECRAALARWDGGRVTVWVGTQTPFPVRAQVAAGLGVAERDVRVVVPPTGGGFGGKHAGAVALEAAVMARAVGGPVKVTWSRHEEFVAATLRPAAVVDVECGATSAGELVAWTLRNLHSGTAGIATPYRVANERLEYQPAAGPFVTGPYRALAATANAFARESHLDELAARLGLDPVALRRSILDDERLVAVLDAAARRFGWAEGARGVGQGVAVGLEKGGRVATLAQVEGDASRWRVSRLVTAYECGALVNPATVAAQVEGAAVMALGGALFERIEFRDGVVTNGSFSAYRVPRFSDVPPIEVVLLDRPDLPSAGAGETPLIAVAPAVANALFDLTGERRRALPLL